jgi:hypothetical protein
MKALPQPASTTKSPWTIVAILLLAMDASAASAEGGAPPCAAAGKPGIRPTFCSIPPTPTNIRTADAYKSEVVDVRRAGLRLTSRLAQEHYSLPIGDTESFADRARTEATPPSSEAAMSSEDTKAFEEDALRRVHRPEKPRP